MRGLRMCLSTWPTLVLAYALLFIHGTGLTQAQLGSEQLVPSEATTLTIALPPARQPPPQGADTLARLRYWNEVLLTANALDHTPVAPGESRVYGEQLGPARTSRAFAIFHIAIFDALNAINGAYVRYTGLPWALHGTSPDAALAVAAHDTLVALYPSQRATFDQILSTDLAKLRAGFAKRNGIDLGRRAAAAILRLRQSDGSQHQEPCVALPCPTGGSLIVTSQLPGHWRQDPIGRSPLALGAFWSGVTPFVMESGDQFPSAPAPDLASAAYAAAYDEVKRLGGDGVITPTERTDTQTQIGIYWAYDGTPGIGTPPRLYNQLVVQLSKAKKTDAFELARLLALVNVALADTAIAVWDSKYELDVWRPVTGIREGDQRGPTGQGDDNPATIGDPTFTPLGAPGSNSSTPHTTPPFPACSSGHAAFGGALFQLLREYYGSDSISFTFVSDELNGVTLDENGTPRPRIPRSFASFSQAEEENGQSRIYLGIHWAFDKVDGIAQGRSIGHYVHAHSFRSIKEGEPW